MNNTLNAYRAAHPRVARARINAFVFGMRYAAEGLPVPTPSQYRAQTHSHAAGAHVANGLADARRVATLARYTLEFGADARHTRSDVPTGSPADWAIADAAVPNFRTRHVAAG